MFALPFFRKDLPALTSLRLKLRMPVAGDYRAWSQLRAASRSFLEPWEPTWTADELEYPAWRHRITRYRADYAQGAAISFFIFDNRNSALIGGITLGGIRRGVSQSAHIGYWIGEPYAGKGYMTEAVDTLARHAFKDMGLHRMEAACIPGNDRSRRVLEKAGFTQEGVLRSYLKINGQWRDHFLYARLAHDPAPVRAG